MKKTKTIKATAIIRRGKYREDKLMKIVFDDKDISKVAPLGKYEVPCTITYQLTK